MKLLKITEEEIPEFDQFFEETEKVSLEDTAPEVIEGEKDVKLPGRPLEDFEAVFARIPVKNAVFGRVLLELIEEKNIALNYPSTGFFIMAKKNYLYHVLHEKNIPAPRTASIASEKAARNLENHLKGPLVAKRFNGLEETEKTRIETVEQIQGFTEGVEYGENLVIFHELSTGEKYRNLVAGEKVISLQDSSENWWIREENLNYSNISDDLKETVKDTKKAIGTNVAEVLTRDGKVVDVNPNPDLEMYTEISGKNAHEAVAEALKEEN